MRVRCRLRHHPEYAVFLNLARRDFGPAKAAEEGDQMNAKANLMAFDPARAPLAVGDNLVFLFIDRRRVLESLF